MTTAIESQDEFTALQSVIAALQPFESEVRQRIYAAAATFLQLNSAGRASPSVIAPSFEPTSREVPYPSFSADLSQSPKQFLLEKQPRSDVERIAVLAYYLTHYRDTPHFKTLDISKLNTEAAQPKFSNAASSANNAVKRGFLVPTTKGNRQLSAAGEQFVSGLPDREAARAAMTAAQPRRQQKRSTGVKKSTAKSQAN